MAFFLGPWFQNFELPLYEGVLNMIKDPKVVH